MSHGRCAMKQRDKILTAIISFSQFEHDPKRTHKFTPSDCFLCKLTHKMRHLISFPFFLKMY
ncbi:UNVERIFIED_CONTAM: hypothetical protein NCL1_10746 [Trichonephila clavipes]